MDYLAQLSQPSPVELARMGDFRAIAHWLNASLMPQGIYARVAADRPGVLLVLLEFFQQPRRDLLNRLVCHRLCRLNSPLIRGVRILARFTDSSEILWDNSVRLVTPATRAAALPPARRRRPRPMHTVRTLAAAPTPPPARPQRRPRPRPQAPAVAPIQALPAAYPASPSYTVRAKRRRVAGRSPRLSLPTFAVPNLAVPRLSVPHLTPLQWRWLGQSAAALLLLGFGAELWSQASIGDRISGLWNRQPSIQTASGRVPIIQTNPPDAQNPTVTLTFTGASSGRHPLPTKAAEPGDASSSDQADPPRIDPANLPEDWLNNAPEVVLQDGQATYIKPWPTADISLAHLNQSLPPDLQVPEQESVKQPRPAAVNVVNVSGNAVAEAGSDGLSQTLETLDRYGLRPLGAGLNQRQARRPEIVEVRGKRIAYLGYSDDTEVAAGRWRAGSNPALENRIAEDIRSIRDQVDWVIVNYHWSEELASYPEEWQMSLARWAIDQGADLVVGYHPDVLQGAEVYRGRAIAYSLGNFVFPNQPQSAQNNYDSAILKVSLREDQMRLEFLPVAVTNDQPAIAQGQKAATILNYMEQASALFEQPLQSPVILDRRASAAPTQAPDAAAPAPADSFIQYPDTEAESTDVKQEAEPAPTDGFPASGSFIDEGSSGGSFIDGGSAGDSFIDEGSAGGAFIDEGAATEDSSGFLEKSTDEPGRSDPASNPGSSEAGSFDRFTDTADSPAADAEAEADSTQGDLW